MSLTKLSLAGNNLIIPGQREFDIPAGDGKTANLFSQCIVFASKKYVIEISEHMS
jgi:hypothetical protein